MKQYQSAQRASSLLDLFPQLAILSVGSGLKRSDPAPPKVPGLYIYERTLEVTLFKPVTVADLQDLTMQVKGGSSRNQGCICLLGVQLGTAWKDGWIRVSHVTNLTVCAGAGIVKTAAKRGSGSRGGGLQFKLTTDFSLDIQQPANDELVLSTLSIVLDRARVAKSGTIVLQCDSRVPGNVQ